MAKKQARRGKKGAKGPAGKRGASGVKGATGLRGARGLTGAKGRSGTRGLKGADANLLGLAAVHKQIDTIYRELEIQMKRMAQIQAELNDVREKMQRIAAGSN